MLDIDNHHRRKLQPRSNIAREQPAEPIGARKIMHLPSAVSHKTARAYDHVGTDYVLYADGEPASSSAERTSYRFEQADSVVWNGVRSALDSLRRSGVSNVRILDAGCGPGGWTKRIGDYCHDIGLAAEIVGVDISTHQLEFARRDTELWLRRRQDQSKISVRFQEQDLSRPLPWPDSYFHIALCNYTVLNHLAESVLPAAIKELCRVTQENVIATLRAIGSLPTACIIGMEHVREYQHDQKRGRLALSLDDGSKHKLPFKLYSAQDLRTLFSPHSSVQDLRAIDIFVSRFAPDQRWTSSLLETLPARPQLVATLKEMEEALCRAPGWVDHGTHVLIVAKPRRVVPEKSEVPATKDGSTVTSLADYVAKSQ